MFPFYNGGIADFKGKIETTCYSVALSLGYTSLREEERELEVIATFLLEPMQ